MSARTSRRNIHSYICALTVLSLFSGQAAAGLTITSNDSSISASAYVEIWNLDYTGIYDSDTASDSRNFSGQTAIPGTFGDSFDVSATATDENGISTTWRSTVGLDAEVSKAETGDVSVSLDVYGLSFSDGYSGSCCIDQTAGTATSRLDLTFTVDAPHVVSIAGEHNGTGGVPPASWSLTHVDTNTQVAGSWIGANDTFSGGADLSPGTYRLIAIFEQSVHAYGLGAGGHYSSVLNAVFHEVPINDPDEDGVLTPSDNCPNDPNPGQEDNDNDLAGDVCDPDDDNDGVADTADNCPFGANPDQADADGDGAGDVCDGDADSDGLANDVDNCPVNANPGQEDLDGDGVGDACDPDTDGDTIANDADNCPTIVNPGQENLDGDALGDACDADIDGDGFANAADNCPTASNPGQDDTDNDGFGNACDADDDGDGVADGSDNCPVTVNPNQGDADNDGVGDACDYDDTDGDGVADASDNCPAASNSGQSDFDGDAIGDVCDDDTDADGVTGVDDACPFSPIGTTVHTDNGCSIADLCPCDGPIGSSAPWANPGQYHRCINTTVRSFVELGLITPSEHNAIVQEAELSTCGN